MKNIFLWSIIIMGVLLIGGIATVRAGEEAVPTIRELPEEVVLFALFKGSYENIGPRIGKLYGVAGQKGIRPGKPLSFSYLNDHQIISSEGWLTEIRIPVGKDALKYAGKLGKMADVKVLPARKVAVAIKAPGQSDRGLIEKSLMDWIASNGYSSTGVVTEVFLSNAQSGDYAQMKSEIIIQLTETL